MKEKILIIDDDVELCRLLKISLASLNVDVNTAVDWRKGLHLAYEIHPSLIILDIMMPEMNGFEVCKRLREMSDVPVLMLTAKTNREDMLHGFQVGADDYVSKPYDLEELKARVMALLKRSKKKKQAWMDIYDDGSLRIDLIKEEVYRKCERIHFSTTEFLLLKHLVKKAGTVCSHKEIINSVWGEGFVQMEMEGKANLSLYIRYLREKLEEDISNPYYIKTGWGKGYWFSPNGDV